MKTVQFKGWNCVVEPAFYANNRIALKLTDAEDGMPVATATVNVPEATLTEGEVLLKGWSENEGLPEVLEQAGLVELTGMYIPVGFVRAQVARLNEEWWDS